MNTTDRDITPARDAPTVPTAVVTLCGASRLHHLLPQLRAVAADDERSGTRTTSIVVWLDETAAPLDLPATDVLHVPPGRHGLRLAAARNTGADRAVALGAAVIVFLDADCVPGQGTIARYTSAVQRRTDAVLCGPVTYLPPGVDAADAGALAAARAPHPARPDPAPGATERAGFHGYPLFWSLSFAVSSERWLAGPRFDEVYEGYGAEDTHFAFELRERGIPLLWLGGADAYHQHHATSTPPWQHIDAILRNGGAFAERWGEWPMLGWIEAFADAGAVRRVPGGWRRV